VPDQNSDSPVDSGINITLGKLIAYPVGLLLVLSGVFGMTISFSGGLLMFISGIFSLPVIRSKIKDKTGIGVNRWAASALVLILFVGGVGLLGASTTDLETEASTNGGSGEVQTIDQPATETGASSTDLETEASTNGGSGEVQTIDQPATELLPTIDDFETGWRGGEVEDGEVTYTNVETEAFVIYNVTVLDSVDEAQSELDSRQPSDIATSDVDIADGGFKYPLDDRSYIVQFRKKNVVCKTDYYGGGVTFDAEGNAQSLAQTCANSISE